MVLRQGEYDPRTRGATLGIASHYVIEVNIRHVLSTEVGKGNEGKSGDRQIDDVTRIVTKGGDFKKSLDKAKRLLDVELAELLNEEEEAEEAKDNLHPKFD